VNFGFKRRLRRDRGRVRAPLLALIVSIQGRPGMQLRAVQSAVPADLQVCLAFDACPNWFTAVNGVMGQERSLFPGGRLGQASFTGATIGTVDREPQVQESSALISTGLP
jgi:hypothetical protein